MTGRRRELWVRLTEVFRRQSRAAELDEELRAHFRLAAEEYERRGASMAEAQRLAAATFGSVAGARQIVREQQGMPRLEGVLADVRYAFKTLRRGPGFAAAAIFVLGLGIAANLAVFAVANAALFKGYRGIAAQDRLIYVTTGRDCCLSHQDLLDWREAARSFDSLAAVADLRVAFDPGTGSETALSFRSGRISGSRWARE